MHTARRTSSPAEPRTAAPHLVETSNNRPKPLARSPRSARHGELGAAQHCGRPAQQHSAQVVRSSQPPPGRKACAAPARSARDEPTNGGGSHERGRCMRTVGFARRQGAAPCCAFFARDVHAEVDQGRLREHERALRFPRYTAQDGGRRGGNSAHSQMRTHLACPGAGHGRASTISP